MTAWSHRSGRYTATLAGCSVVVRLKDAVSAALADGRDSGDAWPWIFEVPLPDGDGWRRGASESLADAQRAALMKAEQSGGVPELVWNVG
jgi:hypothetical protein